jgi:hypothetical protein
VFELSTRDIAVLGAGLFLIAAGVAGLLPMLLHHRKALQGRLRIDESLNPALRAAAAAMTPTPSLVPAPVAAFAPMPVAKAPEVVEQAPIVAEAPVSRFEERQVGPAEELLARLFTIRMMLSEVTEEIHTLREAYADDDDEIVEDIDQADDDLNDIEQDVEPEKTKPAKRLRKVREAA